MLTARYSGPPAAGTRVKGGVTRALPTVSLTRMTVDATERAEVLRGVPRIVPYDNRVTVFPATALVMWTPEDPPR